MNPSLSDSAAGLAELVSFLAAQHESILTNWRIACRQDPLLTNLTDLNQAEFSSGLPLVLTILQQRLAGQPEAGTIAQLATAHGLQRRRKAHGIAQTVQELNHLTQALYNQLAHFQALFPQTSPRLFWSVQQHMTQLMAEVIQGSITLYDELQRSEAADRAAILQQALDQMTLLSQDRSDRLRTSMHDLGGSLGIISGAAGLLQLDDNSEQDKTDYLAMLNRNLAGVQAMLANLMDLSRLEADQETLQLYPLDAAQLLHQMARSVQPLAQERGLVVGATGPDSLRVETDGIKLQRILQNLLLNALKYTSAGRVGISWDQPNPAQWWVCIQDSGPGLPLHLATQLGVYGQSGVRPITRQEAGQPQPSGVIDGRIGEPVGLGQPTPKPSTGEGIGLTIVKEYSQLLGARLEVESAPDQGTSFRLWLPVRYPISAENIRAEPVV